MTGKQLHIVCGSVSSCGGTAITIILTTVHMWVLDTSIITTLYTTKVTWCVLRCKAFGRITIVILVCYPTQWVSLRVKLPVQSNGS